MNNKTACTVISKLKLQTKSFTLYKWKTIFSLSYFYSPRQPP